jgi:regulator of nucleoside diphosphate kinase
VSIIDAKTSEKLKFSLVYPDRVNFALGRVSVFSPLGATILGHRVGDEPDWGEDDEIGRFVIAKVDFQPEAMRRRLRRDNRFDS